MKLHEFLIASVVVLFSGMAGAHVRVDRTVDDRSYIAYLPEDYATRTEPMQVLLALHPATFDAAWFQNIARIEAEDAAEDVIVIYPNGSPAVSVGLSWDAADPRGIRRGDAEFLLAVVDDVSTIAPTRSKFAITGFSAGALMTYKMLGEHGDALSAAIPYAAYFNDTVIAKSEWPATVPVMHMHGTDDARVNPVTGEGDADSLYNFGILSDHMQVVAGRNASEIGQIDFDAVETALAGGEVVPVNDATSYVLLDGIAHYWPRFLVEDMPNASAAVLAFIEATSNGVESCSGADLAEPFGALDFFDVSAFVAEFSGGSSSVDFTGDGALDFFDVSVFLAMYQSGCP
ncbi:MAG: GC-type dockerin domain-anchored protein [Phycisphaerales bacterium JB047]